MLSEELSYVSWRDPFWKRWTMRAIENLSGRRRLLPIYHRWRATIAATGHSGADLDRSGAALDCLPRSKSDLSDSDHLGWGSWVDPASRGGAPGRGVAQPGTEVPHCATPTLDPSPPRIMGVLLDMIGTRLDLQAPAWPIAVPPQVPLVIIANHPFGIGDGIAVLALAEELGRPYRILVNSDFMKLPEIRPLALPIDFSASREAIATNLKSRTDARRLLMAGVTIVVFPAGGVATAEQPFGKAEELPWKAFTARLIQQAQAAVLPVYFEGQNSALFHLISRYSLMLRLSLLVSEFRHFVGATVAVHVGAVVPFAELACRDDRSALTEELYALVHRLAPGAAALGAQHLKPRPAQARRRYPWDPPRSVKPMISKQSG